MNEEDKVMIDELKVDPNKLSKKVLDSVKIGTKEEMYWTEILKKMKSNVENFQHEIVISNQIMKLAQLKIKIEEERRNRK